MAVDKMVDSAQLDNDLTAVANAIRTKSGGSNSLSFPNGFISEIASIPTGGGQTNYRCGTFTITADVSGTAVKVVDLDSDALAHRNDSTLMLAVFLTTATTAQGSIGCIIGNNAFNGTRYGFGVYQTTTAFSSNVISTPANDTPAAASGRAYVGTDGIYIIGVASYKWKAGTYNYALVW